MDESTKTDSNGDMIVVPMNRKERRAEASKNRKLKRKVIKLLRGGVGREYIPLKK